MLYLTGIILSSFLLLLLLLKKDKSRADHILSTWMAIMTLHQLTNYLEFSKIAYQYPHLLGIGFALPLLHGIMLHFYVVDLTGTQKWTLRYILPHFIPFVLLILLAIPFYSLSAEGKKEVFLQQGAGYEWYSLTQLLTILASGIGYVIWSLRKIQTGQKSLNQNAKHQKHLQWVKHLSFGLAIIWILVIFFNDQVIFGGVTALVCAIGILGINQVPVFVGQFESNFAEKATNGTSPQVPPGSRYAKSGLTADQSTELFEQLSQLMEEQEVYKNNELTMVELASALNVHPNYLSQVINEKTGTNFYTYINSLRVEAFLRLATQPHKQHYSLLALAFECGFNSKSTFNKYFKMVMGETPSEYFSLIKA